MFAAVFALSLTAAPLRLFTVRLGGGLFLPVPPSLAVGPGGAAFVVSWAFP